METTAFPPLHALMIYLAKVDYKKHFNNFMDIVETLVIIIAAVTYVCYQKFSQWYQNGGKDFIIQSITQVWNFLQVCYTWVRSEVYPKLVNLCDDVMQTIVNWRDLMTVA